MRALKFYYSAEHQCNQLKRADRGMTAEELNSKGVLTLVEAAPENGKTITASHGELIDGQWVEVIDEQMTPLELARAKASAETQLNALQLIETMKGTEYETAFMSMITGSGSFAGYFAAAGGTIDLNNPYTQEAMTALFGEDETTRTAAIESILLKYAGIE